MKADCRNRKARGECHSRAKPAYLFIGCLWLGTAVSASAQISPSETLIVRAERLPSVQGDQAFSNVDLTADILQRYATLDEALKVQAQGLLFRRASSLSANPTVQGLTLRAIAPSGAGRALVTLEGIPLNDPFGGWVIWAGLPMGAIDKVHIVRGAGGGVYGAGALTGMVELSLNDALSSRRYVSLGASDNQSYLTEAGLASGGLSLSYQGARVTGDVPIKPDQSGPADVATKGEDQAVLGHWQKPMPLGTVSVMAGHYTSDRATGIRGSTAASEGNHLSFALTRAPTLNRHGLKVQAWYKESDLSNRTYAAQAGRQSALLSNDQINTPAEGSGVNAAVRILRPNTEWELGFDARLSSGRAEEYYRYVSGTPTRFRSAGGRSSLSGLYAEGSHTKGALMLTGAVRVDVWRAYHGRRSETDLTNNASVLDLSVADQEKTVPTARLGLRYKLSPTDAVRVAAYSGFRPPSLNELYRPFRIGNDITEANAGLKPEYLSGAELGYQKTSDSLTLDGGIFYNSLSDPITNLTIGLGPGTFPIAGFIPASGSLRQRQNVGKITAYGFEGRATLTLNPTTSAFASMTLTEARVRKAASNPLLNGKRPAQSPPYSLSAGLEKQVSDLRLNADLRFEGERFEDDLNTLPLKASQTLNLGLSLAVSPRVELTATLNNAFDQRAMLSFNQDGLRGYDDCRRLWIGIRYRNSQSK